jgi:hypothetical protein
MLSTFLFRGNGFAFLVHPAGFEPATSWFEAKRSIQMSYGCIAKSH